jgi:hypothetical protein
VQVARFRVSEHIRLAMFAGSGLSIAEEWAKSPTEKRRHEISIDGLCEADFGGFECRWQPIPSQRGEVVSLLVVATDPTPHVAEEQYRNVLDMLERILDGNEAVPVSRRAMRPRGVRDDYSIEARIRASSKGSPSVEETRKYARKKMLIARALMAIRASAGTFNGARYKEEFVENTDFRKFDGMLRMVLDLTQVESRTLEQWLEMQQRRGVLAYGIHRAPAALATCFVRSYSGNHVHFVDGANGGYALAARQLKAQLRARRDQRD